MKKTTLSLLLINCLNFPALTLAQGEVDFSKAYIMPSSSPKELKIGGVGVREGETTVMNWLLLGFNPEGPESKPIFNILQAGAQTAAPELLEQQLRDTVWSGTYQATNNLYLTELRFKVVQNGFIAGEITHKTADPEASNLLRAEVAGTIVTQYFLDVKNDGILTWVNANEVTYEGFIPPSQIRHLINLKRLRGLEYRHTSSSWGAHSEYWMALENNKLTGSVGTPPAAYQNGEEELTSVGLITLEAVPAVVSPPPSPVFE